MRVRAAVHLHSTWSWDGHWDLRDLARSFRRRGYDVLLMAEHDRGFTDERWARYQTACADASTDEMLVVPGIEYGNSSDDIHIAVWGELPFLGEGVDTGELLERVKEGGGIGVLTHPRRREAWRLIEASWMTSLFGIEVWNRKYDGWSPSRLANRLLRENESLMPFVGLDFHTARQFFPLALVLDVEAPASGATVVDAIRARRCRPEALRVPVGRFTEGAGLLAAEAVETVRRSAARGLRSWRRARSRGRKSGEDAPESPPAQSTGR
jgi:hypothetical protein